MKTRSIGPMLLVALLAVPAVFAIPVLEKRSPFLGDLSGFLLDKKDRSFWIYQSEDVHIADYDKFIVDPVLIFQSPRTESMTVGQHQLFSSEFRKAVEDALRQHYTVVTEPDAAVLRLRFAIRDLRPKTTADKVGPTAFYGNSVVESASFEMEGIDSLSGERVVAIVSYFDKQDMKNDTQVQRARVAELFSKWVTYLGARLDAAKAPR